MTSPTKSANANPPVPNVVYRQNRWRFLLLIALVISAMQFFGVSVARAQIVVNSTADYGLVYNGKYGCETDYLRGGVCTLRAAIQFANLDANANTITFNIPGSATINLGSALPALSTDINITGAGADTL